MHPSDPSSRCNITLHASAAAPCMDIVLPCMDIVSGCGLKNFASRTSTSSASKSAHPPAMYLRSLDALRCPRRQRSNMQLVHPTVLPRRDSVNLQLKGQIELVLFFVRPHGCRSSVAHPER